MLVVGAVHPDVHEGSRFRQHARQVGAAHHAVGGPMVFEQAVDVRVMPAGVPELHGDPDPVGQPCQEVIKPRVVAFHPGRQLDQQDGPLVTKLVPGVLDAFDPWLGCVELFGVGQPARRLDGEGEALGQAAPPAGKSCVARPAVEAGIQLDGAEFPAVGREPVARRRPGGVENIFPMVVAPARGADVDTHLPPPSATRSSPFRSHPSRTSMQDTGSSGCMA